MDGCPHNPLVDNNVFKTKIDEKLNQNYLMLVLVVYWKGVSQHSATTQKARLKIKS